MCPQASPVCWSSQSSRSQESETRVLGSWSSQRRPGPGESPGLQPRPWWGCQRRVQPAAPWVLMVEGRGFPSAALPRCRPWSLGGSGGRRAVAWIRGAGPHTSAFSGSSEEMDPARCGLPAASVQVGRALCHSRAVLIRASLKMFPLPRWGPVPISGDHPPPLAPMSPLPVRGRVTRGLTLRGLCLVPSPCVVGSWSLLAPAHGQGRSCAWGTA